MFSQGPLDVPPGDLHPNDMDDRLTWVQDRAAEVALQRVADVVEILLPKRRPWHDRVDRIDLLIDLLRGHALGRQLAFFR